MRLIYGLVNYNVLIIDFLGKRGRMPTLGNYRVKLSPHFFSKLRYAWFAISGFLTPGIPGS
jgi:hypothetical protein